MKYLKLLFVEGVTVLLVMLITRTLDLYNAVAVAIACVAGLGVYWWRARSQKVSPDAMVGMVDDETMALLNQMQTQGDDTDTLIATMLKGIGLAIATLVLAAGLIWFSREYTSIYGQFHDVNYTTDLGIVERIANGKDIPSYLAATKKIQEVIDRGLSVEKEKAISALGGEYLKSAADLAPEKSEQKRQLLRQLLTWAERYGLTDKAQIAKDQLELNALPTPTPVPTATSTPTRTATPNPSPTPTLTPTLVPTPIIKPGESNPCVIPQQFTKVDQVLLHPAVRQEPSGRIPEEFGHASKNVEIVGDELAICISSTPDGKGAPQVDDQVEFDVYMGSTHIGGFPMPFYDPRTKGIKEWPSQKAQWLFPTKGTYRVNTVLTDLIGNVRSSTDLWLVIWR